jgi:xanthine/uracil permease
MIDILVSVMIVCVITVFFRFFLGTRLLTAIVAGFIVGCIISGVFLGYRDRYDDFDSPWMTEKRVCYSILSACASIGLLVLFVVVSHREYRRAWDERAANR